MKKALLASTALVGAALLSAPAQAGSVGTGDNMEVKLSGFVFFQISTLDEDVSAGYGRGYSTKVPEAELHVTASNTADNGIKYGVTIEMEVNTSAGDNADEVYAFLSGDFGRIEFGDQDNAADRMLVGSHNATKGTASTAGGLTSHDSMFHGSTKGANDRYISRSDDDAFVNGDSSKIVYFTPRFSGFQGGIAFTPDTGAKGANFDVDNNGSYENAIDGGLNYVGKFDDVGVSAAITYSTAENEDPSQEDLEVLSVGAKIDFAGFTVGANWQDNNDTKLTTTQTAAGGDAGTFWAVAAGYQQGPWGVGAWYSYGERDVSSTLETKLTRFGVGGRYAVAPGWTVYLDYVQNDHENINSSTTDNDSRAIALTQMFRF